MASFSTKLDQLNGDDDCKTIVERLREQDAKLTDIKSQEEALRTQLSEIRAKDDAKNVDIPQLTQVLSNSPYWGKGRANGLDSSAPQYW